MLLPPTPWSGCRRMLAKVWGILGSRVRAALLEINFWGAVLVEGGYLL